MTKQHRTQHLVFGQLLGFGFHHQYGRLGTGNHQVQRGFFQLTAAGVEDVHAILEAHAGGADRATERNTGNGQGGGSADQGGDIRILVLVSRHDRGNDLHFIHEALGKQRANGAVNQAAGQGFFFAGTTFTLEEATRNTAGGVGLFLVVNGQGEEVLAGIRFFLAYYGDQHFGVTDTDHDSGGGLAGNLPGFQGYRVTAELNLFSDFIEHISSLLSSRQSSRPMPLITIHLLPGHHIPPGRLAQP